MKLAQYIDREKKGIRLGCIDTETERLRPLAFAGELPEWLAAGRPEELEGGDVPLAEIELTAPVSRPGKIIAIGLNYIEHALEGNMKKPREPLVFAKFPNAVCGPEAEIQWSMQITEKVDFEAELVAVIGERASNVPTGKALEKVLGYTCGNDVSARDLQFGDKQWVRGKSLDTFCPLGPWLVTGDELGDPQKLKISARLNGQLMQESSTANMIFSVAELVSFLSRHFTLYPGDLIMTGTPSGVGVFREPPVFMADGDLIEIEIEKIGILANRCRAY